MSGMEAMPAPAAAEVPVRATAQSAGSSEAAPQAARPGSAARGLSALGPTPPMTARGPSVVFTVDNGLSPTPSSALTKDRPRKTVRLPGSIGELNQAATTHLSDSTGVKLQPHMRMRLFHKGREMHHPTHISDLRDRDEIIIRIENRARSLAAAADKLMSTHQAHYIKHPLTPPVSRERDSSAITEQLKQSRLEGRSCYRNDYVKHLIPERPSTCDPSALYATHFMKQSAADRTNKSTYAAHFPWHNAKPIGPAGNDTESALSDAARGHRFTGRSSYMEDFTPRVATGFPARACGNDTASTLTEDQFRKPFDAKSQYAQDFVPYETDGRQPSARPQQEDQDHEKFAGMSEYRHQYVGRKFQHPLVHLLVDN